MRAILTCLLVFALVTVLNGRQYRCDYTYSNRADGWLKLHQIPANWREARLRCHLEGSQLASPLNAQLASAMVDFVVDFAKNCGVFTGIHSTFSRGDFHSVEGIPLSKIPHEWAEREPNNLMDVESCIMMLNNGKLADVNCSEPLPYICYKKTTSAVLSECGTIDSEYKLDSRTGSCYKFHKVKRTWSRAYMACAAEGGHLAIINSDTEATVLKELFVKQIPSSMRGTLWKNAAFIGFHDWGEHGEFLTIEGQSLEQAGYATFAVGQPNNATTGQYCGAMYGDGLLGDLWCDRVYEFICEKRPDSLLCDDDDDQQLTSVKH